MIEMGLYALLTCIVLAVCFLGHLVSRDKGWSKGKSLELYRQSDNVDKIVGGIMHRFN